MSLEQMADFSKIPYSDGLMDHHPDQANISENIVSPPFENKTFQLRAGNHLHWHLPYTLTKEIPGNDRQGHVPAFYHLPNRWLVTKNQNEQFIVESDYLHPETNQQGLPFVTIPNPYKTSAAQAPFRYLGRRLSFSDWQNDQESHQYWQDFNALGYGEPSFVGFYPNFLSKPPPLAEDSYRFDRSVAFDVM